jgi:hypothetical protein
MRVCCIVCMTMLAACSNAPARSEQPALIIQATAASRADLLQAVRAALHEVPVSLADDALTQDSVLLIELQPRLDPKGLLVNGRELGRPERFLLSTDGKRCVLTQEGTQQQWVLAHTQCRARDKE